MTFMLKITKAGNHGILLPQLGIGLDYSGKQAEHVFVSHGHADHIPWSSNAKAVYATPPTKKFMNLRGAKYEVLELPFKQSIETENARVTFYPAGHILGSAMTFVESDFGNLLYTGDYRTPPSPATEGFELPDTQIDSFITEATFSLPVYRWADYEELKAEINGFAQSALDEGYTPVFLAYNLGKAQEIMHLAKDLNHAMQIHGAGFKLCDVYEEEGIGLGNYKTYDRETCEGKILICPSSAINNGFASNVSKKRIAYCSGWATMESRRSQLTVDKLIPISDHLDFFELISLCEQLHPKMTYITHTPNPDVVKHYLSQRNIPSQFLDMAIQKDD
jgi:putative mRNA 3-end processing factor